MSPRHDKRSGTLLVDREKRSGTHLFVKEDRYKHPTYFS